MLDRGYMPRRCPAIRRAARAPADAGSPIRPSLIKRLWDTATRAVERSVHWIPGCRDDLFNRNVCRLSMFGPFYAPGATRDLNDSITEIVEKQLGP
ncbi:MAG: hypothetical protein L6Q69_22545 [Zoogloea sp.]|nr:hypothetical protein [Zoogloea sp.]MCK6538282.1 hypothetical protein [Polyangiaceae bacterium]